MSDSDEITLSRSTVHELIDGARHLYYPAFPDIEKRREIGAAVNAAEGQLEDY
jgi:hypothetical protein